MTVYPIADLTCQETGCPFPKVQQCLEGFDDIAECPNSIPLGDVDALDDIDASDDAGPAPRVDEYAPTAVTEAAPRAVVRPVIELGGAFALGLDDAEDFIGRAGGEIVLVAGPVSSGKTTFVVELYAQFLREPFAGAKFGGSETLRALDYRRFPSTEPSGAATPTTDRTSDEDMRLLHLRLAMADAKHELLFSDVRGELFENIIEGAPVAHELGIGQRVDRCLLVIDGERAANPRHRDGVFTKARQLAGGLREEGGLAADTPVAVLCTKWDLVDPSKRAAIIERAKVVASFAAGDGGIPTVLTLSVRPGPPATAVAGLDEVLAWLCNPGGAPK